MIEIPAPQQPPELDSPSLPQAVKFFTPKQKKILIVSSIIFGIVLIASGAVFYLWLTSFKTSLVDFKIDGPSQAASGEPVSYLISYWNNTSQILQNAALTIRYPQETIVPGGKMTQSIDLGSIGIGGGGKQEIKFSFIGPDKSIQKLQTVLSYKPQNTTSTFENEVIKEVAINGSALSIDFKTPEAVLPNAKNIYTVHYKNNTDEVFKNVSVEIKYPFDFTFVSSDKTPAKDNNIWNLGDLNPDEEGDIVIVGILKNVTNAGFELAIGANENGKFYKFNQVTSQINLTALPLKISITANGESNLTVNPGDFLRFKINYENNAGVALSDVILKAKLDGLMYDLATLKTDGFYSGVDNTITWNAANMPDFKSLTPNNSGEVRFEINVKPRYVVRTFRDKNFLLQVSTQMETPTVPSSLAIKELSVSSDLAIKVNTRAELKVKGYYYDAALKNSGPLPPKVNQQTTYTVHWQITNYSNDLENVAVKSTLPEGVSWINKKAGAGASTLEYNDRTNELTWNVGKIAAGIGVLLDPYEAIFQVALTPPVTQAGQVVPILGESVLTAKDIFTGNDIAVNVPLLKTDLPDDSGVGINRSRVQP